MIDRMSDISRIVDRMIDKGIVSKCINGDDKRLVDISLTESGQELLNKIGPLRVEGNEFLGNLTESDAKILNTLLDRIRGYE